MVYRYRRRYRRRGLVGKRRRIGSYKRKTRTSRFSRPKMTRYDGVVYSRIITTGDYTVNGANPFASLVVSWGDSGTDTAQERFINNNTEFSTMTGIYEQYKIVGLKIKVNLISQVTNASGSGIYALNRASDPNTQYSTTATISSMARKMDYKQYNNTMGGIKMYYNVGKFFAKTNLQQGWYDVGTYPAPASTMIRTDEAGFASDAVIGKYQIIWYVKFRSFKV